MSSRSIEFQLIRIRENMPRNGHNNQMTIFHLSKASQVEHFTTLDLNNKCNHS